MGTYEKFVEWAETLGDMVTIPMATKPKARPVVGQGRAYMPEKYEAWKTAMIEQFREHGHIPDEPIDGKLSLVCIFDEGETEFQLYPVEDEYLRAKHVRGDIDNLVGGLMDALQDAGIIKDDNQIITVSAMIARR